MLSVGEIFSVSCLLRIICQLNVMFVARRICYALYAIYCNKNHKNENNGLKKKSKNNNFCSPIHRRRVQGWKE